MPYVWITCIACNGKGHVFFISPVDGRRKKMPCTACSGLGKVYVDRPGKKKKK